MSKLFKLMENLRSFNVTYVPWTNTRPARVRIRDNRHNGTVFIAIEGKPLEEAAKDYLISKGIAVLPYVSEDKKGFILLTRNFETKIK